MDWPLTARRSTTVEEGRPETYSPGENSRKVKEGQGRSRKVKTRSRQGQDKVKTRSRQGQDKVKTRSRQGQDKVKTRSRQGQDKVKTRSRQGQDNPSLPPVALVSRYSSRFWVKKLFRRASSGEAIPPWPPSRTRKLLLTFLSKSSRQMRMRRSRSRSSEPGFEQLLT